MKKLKKLLVGGLALVLAISLVAGACAPATPEEAAGEIAELEDELAASEKEVKDLKGDVSDLEKKLAKAEAAAAPVPIEPEYKIALALMVCPPKTERVYKLFSDLINLRGEGRVEVTFYSSGVLGTIETNIEDIKAGVLEMAYIDLTSAAGFLPWITVAEQLPFAWTSPSDQFRWGETIFLPVVNKELVPHNVLILPYLGTEGLGGFISRAGPIHSPADLKGKVFRANSPGLEPTWMEALGAKPVIIPWEEVFTSMETGMFDVMHQPLGFMMEYGFAEVSGDFTVTNHKMWLCGTMVNLEWWNSLPEDIQTIIDDAWYDAASVFKSLYLDENDFWIEEATKPPYNMGVYIPTVDELAQFKAAMTSAYDFARQEFGDYYVDLVLDYAK